MFILAIAVTGFAWFQVSPWTLRLFTKICDANGGPNCMVFYWKQSSFYWGMFRIFTSLSVFLGLGTVFLIFAKKNENKKSKKNKNRK